MTFMTLLFLLCSLFGLLRVIAAVPTQFCATISPNEAAGAKGWVALQIENGVAEYSFYLDLSGYNTETLCPDISEGLKYHIHTEWSNTTVTSSANSYCGESYAGGHYDPNFACSNFSSYKSNDCPSLGRTWVQGYRYACNTTNYANMHYSLCEVGDVSSKNGILKLNSDNIVQLSSFVDYQPPYAINYGTADKDSTAWLSFVFHCAQNTERLVCAKFSSSDLSSCSSALNSFAIKGDDDTVSQSDFDIAVILTACLCTVGGVVIGLIIMYCAYGTVDDSPIVSNKEKRKNEDVAL